MSLPLFLISLGGALLSEVVLLWKLRLKTVRAEPVGRCGLYMFPFGGAQLNDITF